jgi:hypothetical protein
VCDAPSIQACPRAPVAPVPGHLTPTDSVARLVHLRSREADCLTLSVCQPSWTWCALCPALKNTELSLWPAPQRTHHAPVARPVVQALRSLARPGPPSRLSCSPHTTRYPIPSTHTHYGLSLALALSAGAHRDSQLHRWWSTERLKRQAANSELGVMAPPPTHPGPRSVMRAGPGSSQRCTGEPGGVRAVGRP